MASTGPKDEVVSTVPQLGPSKKLLWLLPFIGGCAIFFCLIAFGWLLWSNRSSSAEGQRPTSNTVASQVDQLSGQAEPSPTRTSRPTLSAQGDVLALPACQSIGLTATARLTGPLLSSITFATRQDAAGWPLDPGLQFTTTITQIQASFAYAGMEPGVSWERVWYFGDKELLRGRGRWDAGESGQLTLYTQASEGGFLPGRYRLEIVVAGQVLSEGSVVLLDEATPTGRPVEVAYTVWDGQKHSLNLLDLETAQSRPLLEFGRQPAWSPDAVGLLFRGEDGIEAGSAGLWVYNVNQQQGYQLSADTAFESIAWSPDRRFMATARIQAGQPRLVLWELENNQAYPGPTGAEPAWSPEGRRLAYRGCNDGAWGIATIEVISNVFRVDTRQQLTQGDDSQPAWSPDGQHIAFVRRDRDNQDIYLVAPDGSRLTRLTDQPGADTTPAWTRDHQILFWSWRNGGWGIYQMEADGSNQRLLIEQPLAPADWSPDQLAVSPAVKLVEPPPPPTPNPRVQIPPGHGLLVVSNLKNNDEMTFTINNIEYKIGPFRYKTISLPPGHYTWTASWPGKTSRTGIADLVLGQVAYPVIER